MADTPSMLRPGQAVALCVLALLTFGVVMVNSAGMTVRPKESTDALAIVTSKYTVNAVLAIAAMGVCAWLPIRRLMPGVRYGESGGVLDSAPGTPDGVGAGAMGHTFLSISWFKQLFREQVRLWPLWLGVLGLGAILATVYMPGIARARNGSHRWINLHAPGLDSVQPSELAKWGLVLLLAWYGARSAQRMKSFWLGLVPGLAAAGLIAAIVVVEDLGTGALLGMTAVVMLLAAGGRLWQLALLMPVPLAGAAAAIFTSQYRMNRIESFFNPYKEPLGKGYHMIQSMLAVSGGDVTGRGLGHGLQKFEYLPEDTTDFLFAVICEELGVAGAALVLFLLAMLLWSVYAVMRREQTLVLKLLALGVMTMLGVQALINLAVVTGLGPTKGIALPLLSSGGTGWIMTAAALGLVIAIDRTRPDERVGVVRTERAGLSAAAGAIVLAGGAMAGAAPVAEEPAVVSASEQGEPDVVQVEAATEVVADQVAETDSADEPEQADEIETVAESNAPVADVVDERQGETGLLFAEAADATPSTTATPAASPTIVITDAARSFPASRTPGEGASGE